MTVFSHYMQGPCKNFMKSSFWNWEAIPVLDVPHFTRITLAIYSILVGSIHHHKIYLVSTSRKIYSKIHRKSS